MSQDNKTKMIPAAADMLLDDKSNDVGATTLVKDEKTGKWISVPVKK